MVDTIELSPAMRYRASEFSTIDYAILVLLIVVSLIIGIVVGIKGWTKASTRDFLVGGRTMHPFPVAMSLVGGVLSAISVLGLFLFVLRVKNCSGVISWEN